MMVVLKTVDDVYDADNYDDDYDVDDYENMMSYHRVRSRCSKWGM